LLPQLFVRVFKAVIWWMIIGWFGLPIAALGWLTGWLSVLWAAVHLAVVGRDERAWTFLEYGSTSLALLQAVILAVLDLTARRRRWRLELGLAASGRNES
jgi:hypothetical protein